MFRKKSVEFTLNIYVSKKNFHYVNYTLSIYTVTRVPKGYMFLQKIFSKQHFCIYAQNSSVIFVHINADLVIKFPFQKKMPTFKKSASFSQIGYLIYKSRFCLNRYNGRTLASYIGLFSRFLTSILNFRKSSSQRDRLTA